MRSFLYAVIKKCTQFAFFLYYKDIRLKGTEHVPVKKPLLFLPNHQNALLDPLIMAAYSKRKPYFLTRSDIFTNRMVRTFFELLRMIPIYRIRDGRANLQNNETIFARCSALLCAGESLVIFPEGNHNILRRVRPLSKGFTRILFKAMEQNPSLEIDLIPVGVNYMEASGFPDSAAFYFGSTLPLRDFLKEDRPATVRELKSVVYDQLITLTTHIDDLEQYDAIAARLDQSGAPYLHPQLVNKTLNEDHSMSVISEPLHLPLWKKFWDALFIVVNAPAIALWRLGIKKVVPEIEFLSTFRFLYCILVYPLYYLAIIAVARFFLPWYESALILAVVFGFNLAYVKFR